MAKKKKKQHNQNRQTKDTAGYSTYEETVRRIYQLCLREVKKNRPESERIFESMDYDHDRMKRRMEATLWSMEELHQRITSVYPDLPEMPTAAECWAESNAIPSSAYDLEEEFKTGALGAAIWMLDQIKESGKLYELVQLLPSDADPHELGMPEIWDPCHSTDVLAGMLHLIQHRNEDCMGLERRLKKEPGVVKRCYMDLYTTERLHKQDVPSRNRFEAAVSYILEETTQAAVQYFMEKYWDFTVRYFQSHALFAHEEKQIRDDLAKFKTKSDIMMEKLQQMTRKELELPQAVQTPSIMPMRQPNIAVMTQGTMLNMTVLSRHPDATQIITQMVAEENDLDERSEVLQQKKTGLWADLRQYPIKGKGWFAENYGEEIAEIWDGFEAENPYAICFAFLYLLDSGSEIPWLYLPSGSVLSMAMDALPWTRTRYREDIEGIWNHFDEDCGEVLPGSGRVDLPKRIKVPELENWYRMEYMDRYEDDPEYQERYSLAQIMYEVTGCIMPRNPRRFYPALTEWDRYGINGKKALHPLVYSMSLLGEARQQSRVITPMDIDWADEEPEVEQETDSVAELKAKIAFLQGEAGQLRKTVYETGRELREARKAAEIKEQKAEMDRQELADLRELVFHLQEDVYDAEPEYIGIAFPYHNFQRIVVFGGHDSWAREIKPRLPDVRFVDKDMVPNAELIRRADIVWIQANAISHAFYYKILDETRKHSIPVRYFSYASALKCAEQLAEQDMKESQK